jgi:Yip1-like protein
LPSQYIKIFTKPSAITFAQENGKAAWNIIWVQLLGLAVLSILFGFAIFSIVLPAALASNQATASMAAAIGAGTAGLAFSMIVFVPLSFFIGTGIQYLIAKMFGGQGAFLNHSYGSILIYVPYTIMSVVLSLIPILGSLASFALGIYSIVLQVYMIMAVHRMGGGKATMVVLFPLIVVFVLACAFFFILIAALSSHPAPQ